MTGPVRLLAVLGTRPEAVKLLPVLRLLADDPDVALRVAHTGQHRELAAQILAPFGIEPDVDLAIMEPGQTLNGIVARTMPRLDAALTEIAPDMVMVQGDTTSAFCAALAAFQRGIPVAHLEAGLRSGDRFHPYPEEANRRMISCVADLHLAPTPAAAGHLAREGVAPAGIVVTGNTVVDALLLALGRGGRPLPRRAPGAPPLVLVTLHRRESWQPARPDAAGEAVPLERVLAALRDVAAARPDALFLFPIHPNPRVRELARQVLGERSPVRLVEPLGYFEFAEALAQATVVVTDSGGIQEEAPSLGVPVLVCRETTERPEGVAAGCSRLAGLATERLRDMLLDVLDAPPAPPRDLPAPNPFGDGRAAARVRAAVLHWFSLGPRPDEFRPPTVRGGETT